MHRCFFLSHTSTSLVCASNVNHFTAFNCVGFVSYSFRTQFNYKFAAIQMLRYGRNCAFRWFHRIAWAVIYGNTIALSRTTTWQYRIQNTDSIQNTAQTVDYCFVLFSFKFEFICLFASFAHINLVSILSQLTLFRHSLHAHSPNISISFVDQLCHVCLAISADFFGFICCRHQILWIVVIRVVSISQKTKRTLSRHESNFIGRIFLWSPFIILSLFNLIAWPYVVRTIFVLLVVVSRLKRFSHPIFGQVNVFPFLFVRLFVYSLCFSLLFFFLCHLLRIFLRAFLLQAFIICCDLQRCK